MPEAAATRLISASKLRRHHRDIRLRRKEENLARLEADLRERGQQYPLRVHEEPDGTFTVYGGMSRFMAGQRIPLAEYLCIVEAGPLDEGDVLEAQLLDQELTTSLTKLEKAKGVIDWMRLKKRTQAEAAAMLKVSEGEFSRIFTMFNCLAPDLLEKLLAGDLDISKAYQISRLKDDHPTQRELAARDLKRDLLKRAIDPYLGKRVRRLKPVKFTTSGGLTLIVPSDLDYDAAEAELKEALKRLKKGRKFGEVTPPVLLPS